MLKTIEIPALELKESDLIFDIKPEDSTLLPVLFKVLKINNGGWTAEIINENDRGYRFSYVDNKKCVAFTMSSTTTWYKLVY